MRGALVLLAALLPTAAAAQTDPVEIGIRAVQALAATAAANDGDPHFTPTPLAQKEPKPLAVQPDGASVETIVTGLYAAVTHGPEYEPNWKRLRALFLPKAVVVPPKRPEAEAFAVLDADAFEARIRAYIAGRRQRGEALGFTEHEIARRENRFGNVCQVFSTYETLRAPHDKEPFARGVHSIQLVYDGWRWWIAGLAWDNERPDTPIPPAMLPTALRWTPTPTPSEPARRTP
jgi:hypothetical protein